jgi:hypothetical protein
MSKVIRVGNASGFWGDSPSAPVQLVEKGELDVLTLDYLAEVTLSILAKAKIKDPTKGYATDFVEVLPGIAKFWKNQSNLKIVTNAGGMNPASCGEACAEILCDAGMAGLKIALVSGDDFVDQIDRRIAEGFCFPNQDNGESIEGIRDRIVSANVYVGVEPIVAALLEGARLVLTGRVTDPAMVLAAGIEKFGWAADDWDRLAGGTVAGHLIECGAQVTGGIYNDWLEMPDPAGIGYPIVEMAEDGSCVVTKPDGTGGVVNEMTVKEQLMYEIGDPAEYITADVIADFTTLRVKAIGENRVQVSGATGKPATAFYKASITFRDGYAATGEVVMTGEQAVAKARRAGESVLERVRGGGAELAESQIDVIGGGACGPGLGREDAREVMLRISVRDAQRSGVERFTREMAMLVTAGPPGTTGYAQSRGRVREVLSYWPTLVPKSFITPKVDWMEA